MKLLLNEFLESHAIALLLGGLKDLPSDVPEKKASAWRSEMSLDSVGRGLKIASNPGVKLFSLVPTVADLCISAFFGLMNKGEEGLSRCEPCFFDATSECLKAGVSDISCVIMVWEGSNFLSAFFQGGW